MGEEVKIDDIWDKEKIKSVNDFILSESNKQSPEQKLKNESLGLKYENEDSNSNNLIECKFCKTDITNIFVTWNGIRCCKQCKKIMNSLRL